MHRRTVIVQYNTKFLKMEKLNLNKCNYTFVRLNRASLLLQNKCILFYANQILKLLVKCKMVLTITYGITIT